MIPPFFCPCIFLGGSLGSEPSSGPDKDSHRTKAAWVLDPWIRGRPSALPVWEMVVDEKGAGSTDFIDDHIVLTSMTSMDLDLCEQSGSFNLVKVTSIHPMLANKRHPRQTSYVQTNHLSLSGLVSPGWLSRRTASSHCTWRPSSVEKWWRLVQNPGWLM